MLAAARCQSVVVQVLFLLFLQAGGKLPAHVLALCSAATFRRMHGSMLLHGASIRATAQLLHAPHTLAG